MGCFLACFGVKGHQPRTNHFISSSIPPETKVNQESLETGKKLGSFLLNEEFDENNFYSEPVEKSSSQDGVQTDNIYAELRDEAKFLKSCGAILQTPAEIRKASAYKIAQDGGDGVCSNPVSLHCDSSVKKLFWDAQPGEVVGSPSQEQKNSQLSCNSSNSFQLEAHRTSNTCDSSLPLSSKNEPMSLAGTKSACVDEKQMKNENPEASPSKNALQGQQFASEYSPFATPQKLTDEMETPATVYPSNIEKAKSGRNARIHSQYVFPVNLGDSKPSNLETSSDINDRVPRRSAKSEVVVESLSQLLKPTNEASRMNFRIRDKESSDSGKNSDVDRPIIGMVAAHWNDSESDNKSIKWWDGNGIPNSTNKYKEDQKVSWHATPFEERLEKALSEENLLPQRKFLCGKLVQFEDDSELRDTAAS